MLLFFADDLAYYWFHRVSHESRVFWASHVVHHSSQHYNLSTALRQTWVPMTYFPFWLPLPLLGFPPWTMLLAQSWWLIYQFWIHTERIRRFPRWVEAVFNTPSHHRVHHGSNEQYLDRNYGGILDHLGPPVRHVRARGRARPLRPDEEPRDVQPGPGRVPRVHRAVARHPRHPLLADPLEPAGPRTGLPAAYFSRRDSRRSLSTRPSVWSVGQ